MRRWLFIRKKNRVIRGQSWGLGQSETASRVFLGGNVHKFLLRRWEGGVFIYHQIILFSSDSAKPTDPQTN